MTSQLDAIVIPSSSPEQNWARSVSPCTPSRLLGVPPLSSSPPSLPSPSKLLETVVTGLSELRSPKPALATNKAKANVLMSTTDKRTADETSAKITQPGASKAKTGRNRKTTKSQEPQNKVLKGRVAKASVSKTKATNDKYTTKSQHEDVNHTPKSERKNVVDSEGLNLEEASRRRLDWTPPKSAPFISLKDDNASQSSGTKTIFGDILRDYHYSSETSVPEVTRARKEGNPTKRRRLELVDLDIQQTKTAKKKQAKQTENVRNSETRKAKAKPQKQPKTITARMTALYEPIRDPPGPPSCDEEDLDDSSGINVEKKPTKKKKRSTKHNEPEYIILSPDAATKSLNNQDFLFGTCSQLERDDSFTLFQETQRALRISETYASENTVTEKGSMVSMSTGITSRFTGTKDHWSSAARGFDGSMIQPEVIDMTNSPYTSTVFKQTTSETRCDAPKAKAPIPAKRTANSDRAISNDVPLCTGFQQDTQKAFSSSKPAVVGRDAEVSAEQPLTQLSDMPNFNGYTDTELSKQIASYGFKAVRGRKKMICLLEKCWKSKRSTEKDSTESVETTSNSVAISTAASTVIASEKPLRQNKKTKSSDSGPKANSRYAKTKQTDKTVTRKTKNQTPGKSSLPAPTLFNNTDEIQDSEEEIIPSPTRIRMQQQSSSRQATPAISCLSLSNKGKRPLASAKSSTSIDDANLPDLLDQVTKAIRLQPHPLNSSDDASQNGQSLQRLTWHEKILLYDPIILEDFTTWLNTDGLALVCEDREVSAAFVRNWCESQGICCTYRT